MTEKEITVETFAASIYIAGELSEAKSICRKFCFDVGLCVTVVPCDFIYTGGSESGVQIGLVNYPRFPSSPDELLSKAESLARLLMSGLCQWSSLIVSSDKTKWITTRPEYVSGDPQPRGGE